MVKVTTKQLDDAAAAYYRATGTAPNRAGLRAALHSLDISSAFESEEHYAQQRLAAEQEPEKHVHDADDYAEHCSRFGGP